MPEDGYIYIYVANETQEAQVNFDDITVSILGFDISEMTDYYPGGSVASHWEKEPYRFGYQGEYSEEDQETGFNHFEARAYDSRINRWMVTDPARQYASPYKSMGNNWIRLVDPDGRYDNPKNWFQRTWNNLTFRGGLNDAYAIKAQSIISGADLARFDELNSAGLLDRPESFNAAGEIKSFGMQARTAMLGVTGLAMTTPVLAVGAGELATGLPYYANLSASSVNIAYLRTASAVNSAYWKAGAAYNFSNIVASQGLRVAAGSVAAFSKPLLMNQNSPKFFQRMYHNLRQFNKTGNIDLFNTAQKIYEGYGDTNKVIDNFD
ncbi:hypothetical protein N7E81_02925 [Reichenbachiella carrageenanivorans]|uniref:RHS repeat-associated core domain-containing protein n=1 Tax=Reichenbachiella carrageenanivorans TaxID=2979869 RepID=A0ABY6D4L3_9BACT|nr:RHS repeat-associated core domain-containing protein [Reichenbachiella carrageenanivorans]UXX80058.1 hypothetical protein N7E81_02925 [Reichenbachiella carrageenanivorans]